MYVCRTLWEWVVRFPNKVVILAAAAAAKVIVVIQVLEKIIFTINYWRMQHCLTKINEL